MEYKHIALTGTIYSGKSTLAHALELEGYLYVGFSDLLKVYAVRALSAVEVYTSVEEINEDKRLYRPFLQGLGTVIGFDVEERYVMEALKLWDRMDWPRCVFDTPRTFSQVNTLKRLGFTLVGLTLSPHEQAYRAAALGVPLDVLQAQLSHPVERGISPDLFDLTLNGADPIETNIQFLLGNLPYSEQSKRIA